MSAMKRINGIFEESEVCRIDVYVAQLCEITRSRAAKLIEFGAVYRNGVIAQKNIRLKIGDEITVNIPENEEYDIVAENIPLDIIYEDEDLLVVNKPKNMVVHPAVGNYSGTLVNAVMFHCGSSLSGINGVLRPGILHRIDKNTSGLLLIAKNDIAHNFLAAQIKEHSFTREYEAVVYGNIADDFGTINAPIGRHSTKRKQMAVTDKNSKQAITHFTVLERFGTFTHLKLRLETGRTHQIRVHMAYIGHPVAGDEVYGPRKIIKKLEGQCLHARKIGFVHPNGKYMEFTSDLPEYFENFLEECRTSGNI